MNVTRGALTIILVIAAVIATASAGEQQLEFTPPNGFSGHSTGRGTLKLLIGKPRPFEVSSRGHAQDDGTFRLDQTVTFEGKPPQQRFWILHPIGVNRFSATLSDAAGRVTGETDGRQLSLRYRVVGPLVMHQELVLSPDSRTINNVGVITFVGIPIGRLHETIIREIPRDKSG